MSEDVEVFSLQRFQILSSVLEMRRNSKLLVTNQQWIHPQTWLKQYWNVTLVQFWDVTEMV